MQKQKVLILSSAASVIEQFNRINIRILKNLNYDVTVLANFKFGNTTSNEKMEEFFNELIDQGINVINFPIPRKINLVLSIKSYFFIKQLIISNKFSLIHCHMPVVSMLLRIICLFNSGNKIGKVIYTAHGFHFYKGAPIINWLLFYPIEKLLSKYTDCLITINNEDYKRAKKSFKTTKSIVRIDGVGVDTKTYFPLSSKVEKVDYRKQYGYSENDFIIISVAEFNKNKNHRLIIEAIKKLVDKIKTIKVLLVGIGPDLENIKSDVKKYSLNNYISFLGYRKDIERLLKISDLFISSSKREGLPVSMIEAMATGLPIIATNNRGHRSLISNLKNGFLVPDNDPVIFSDRIHDLISSKDKRDVFSLNNINNINKYSEENIIQKTRLIYLNMQKRYVKL